MKLLVVALALLISPAANAFNFGDGSPRANLKQEIFWILGEIRNTVSYSELNNAQLLNLRDQLQESLDSIHNGKSPLICTKSNSGYFYPTNRITGAIVGSTGINAGYDNLVECQSSLPGPKDKLACFKQNSGYFYPGNAATGAIIGSSGLSAGHDDIASCKQTLPKPFEKVACFKHNNGYYYPTNPQTGSIIGSSSIGAGYEQFKECRAAIDQ